MAAVNPYFAQFEKQWNQQSNCSVKTDGSCLRTSVVRQNFIRSVHPSIDAAQKLKKLSEARRIRRAHIFSFIKEKFDAEEVVLKANEYQSPQIAHTIPAMPMELFRKDSAEQRRILFFENLQRGDMLYLQVINNVLSDSYKLWVLAKEGDCVKLDDLLIIVYLPKFTGDLKYVDGKLEQLDLIRGALCSCCIRERKLYVSLDSSFLKETQKVAKLGRVTNKELPHYLGRSKPATSYVKYIKQSKEFYNPDWLKQLHDDGHINMKRQYSFFKGLEGKTYPDHEYASVIKKKYDENKSDRSYLHALRLYGAGYHHEALAHVNKALAVDPDNIQALLCRGTLHANANCLRRAFIDTENALRLNPTYDPARKQMSVLLVAAARTHLEQGFVSKAKESLEQAAQLDENNPELHDAKWDYKLNVTGQTQEKDTLFPPSIAKGSFRPPLNKRSYFLPPIKIPVAVAKSGIPSSEGSIASLTNADMTSRAKKKKMKKHHRKRSKHHHHPRHRHHHHKYKARSQSPRRRFRET